MQHDSPWRRGEIQLDRPEVRRWFRARLKSALWKIAYPAWVLRESLSGEVDAGCSQKLTVLIPTYSPERMSGLATEIRPLLKCMFIDRIILSNHNPEVRVRNLLKLEDPRLVMLDQPRRRGPGFVYTLAAQQTGEYFMSIDDDVLLRSRQVARLFEYLLANPAVPHGLAGCRGGVYVQNRETEVDELYLVYAVSRAHVRRYLELTERLLSSGEVSEEDVELWSDDIVVSVCGESKPQIHRVGFFLQSGTCYTHGIAIHKAPEFEERRQRVRAVLERVLMESETCALEQRTRKGTVV